MRIIKVKQVGEEKAIEETVKVLRSGGLVVFPSDTVYGFLADATSEKAVRKLISFKNRPAGKPISVFVDSFEMLKDLVKVEKNQEKVLKELLPGPFTIVLPSKGKVSPLIESEKKTLGVRLPAFEPVVKVVKTFGRPTTATSANLSGKGPHWQVSSFLNTLSSKKKRELDLVVDAGKLPYRKPSTVVDLTSPKLKVLRKGEIVFLNTKVFVSDSPKKTRELGEYFAAKYLPAAREKGLVLVVEGELGVGKTQLAKGVGKFLGVGEEIVSPSFVGFFEYKAKKVEYFYHFDLWGAREAEEVKEFGFKNLIGKLRVVYIEWGERIAEVLDDLQKAFLVYIKMEYQNEKERRIEISEIKP